MAGISVLVVDDDPMVCTGVSYILRAGGLEVVGQAADGARAVAEARTLRPDVVLMDIQMPVLDGIEATRRLRALTHPPRIVMLTTFEVDDYVTRSIDAGADGFVLKVASPEEMCHAVRVVATGDAFMSPAATRRLLAHVAHDRTAAARARARRELRALTERERQVLVASASGRTNAEIGVQLHLSAGTVKSHMAHMCDKLGRNRTQLAILAERAGWLVDTEI